jgi:uncharacterized protein YlaI
MQSKNFKNLFNDIELTTEEKDKILNNIFEKNTKKFKKNYKYLSIAVSFIIVFSLTIFLIQNFKVANSSNIGVQTTDSNNNKINSNELELSLGEGGFGYSAIMLKNQDELRNQNPWTKEINLDKLPVYKDNFTNINYDDIANEIAKKLNIKIIEKDEFINNTDIKEKNIINSPIKSYICEKGIVIDITKQMISINWKTPIQLPKINKKLNDIEKEMEYVKHYYNLYKNLINVNEVEFEVTYDYSFNGDRFFNSFVFENTGNIEEKIFNYNFNKFQFSIVENGLVSLSIPLTREFTKIGQYEIINSESAIDNVLKGDYVTTIPNSGQISKDDIAKIELVYLDSGYIQPVYLFYIKINDNEINKADEKGLETYGMYYTPAIEGVKLLKCQFN